ncbi:MAG: SAM-dependent methyltransferase [Verrucomicrobiae bacterium]|nr:SAM-dependent methyltransferase [Verrucomicrobiae bacterium]
MDLVLYDPGLGYYSRRGDEAGFREVGRSGDFFTSVSVGETFGFLLAQRIVHEWEGRYKRPSPFVIVEQGGHDGRLARDIVAALRESGSPLAGNFEYRLVEPRPALREFLERSFSLDPVEEIRIAPSLEEARAEVGLFVCNELLDAFPVDLITFESGRWRELRVAWDGPTGRPAWSPDELRPELAAFAADLGTNYPEGYRTEVCLAVDSWMAEAATLFKQGLWWIIDYGHERDDYYPPERRDGTLRCYHAHRSGNDPFAFPGEQDLTADVDFTRVEEAALRLGLARRRFTDQHHFLIEAAKPWLLSLEGQAPGPATAKRLRQFQTLTHPSMMGQQFKILELERFNA